MSKIRKQLFKQGFTLIELSIVIIIIGLLIAGVSAGRSLVNQTQLYSIIKDFTKIKVATAEFKSRFNAVAGDFKDGYSYWGTVGNCTNTYVNNSPHDGCNGNGDGNLGPNNDNYENRLMFKHLNLAGILDGKYSGTDDNGHFRLGIDVPKGPLQNSGYYATYDSYWGIAGENVDMLGFGADYPGAAPIAAILRPDEAKAIDVKIDDGLPVTGKILSGTAPVNSNGHCTNGSGPEDLFSVTEYMLSNPQVACRMMYLYGRD